MVLAKQYSDYKSGQDRPGLSIFERIIVPLDGSRTAEVALPYAEEIAGRMHSDMVLLFVSEPEEYMSPLIFQRYLERIAKTAQAGAEGYRGECGAADVKVETKTLAGNAVEEIVRFADSTEGGAIVMATHGRSGITRWALGSVADKVSRATIRPVAVIRARGSEPAVHPKGILKKILVPLDGSKECEAELPYVIEMASKLKGEVTLIEVLKVNYFSMSLGHVEMPKSMRQEAEGYLNKIAKFLQEIGIRANYYVIETEVIETDGNVASEIIKYTQDNYTDLIIMAKHGRLGPGYWILGRVTDKVLRQGNTPIMLVQPGTLITNKKPADGMSMNFLI